VNRRRQERHSRRRRIFAPSSIDPGMTIDRIRLEEKTGGTHGDWRRGEGRIPPQV